MQCTLESNLRLLKRTTAIEKKHKSLQISREGFCCHLDELRKARFFCFSILSLFFCHDLKVSLRCIYHILKSLSYLC